MQNSFVEMQSDFFRQASDLANAHGLPIAAACEGPLNEFITECLNRMDNGERTPEGLWLDFSHASLNVFVTALVSAARHEGLSEVNMGIFETIEYKFLSLWPCW